MWSFRNIHENSIQEENISLDVEMLTPGKTEIKEEFT